MAFLTKMSQSAVVPELLSLATVWTPETVTLSYLRRFPQAWFRRYETSIAEDVVWPSNSCTHRCVGRAESAHADVCQIRRCIAG